MMLINNLNQYQFHSQVISHAEVEEGERRTSTLLTCIHMYIISPGNGPAMRQHLVSRYVRSRVRRL